MSLKEGAKRSAASDVRYRDGREPLITLTAVVVKFAVQNFLRCRPAQNLMRFVHLGQQLDIRRRVVARKPVSPVAPLAHPAHSVCNG